MKHKMLCALLAAATVVSSEGAAAVPLLAKESSPVLNNTVAPAADEGGNTESTDAKGVLDAVKAVPPVLSEDGASIVLPESTNEDYEVILYGSSNEAVVSMDGKVHAPLEDMKVSFMYKVVSKTDPEDFALDQRAETELVIPGRYSKEETDNARPEVLPGIQEWKGGNGQMLFSDASRLVVQDESLLDTAAIIAEYFESMLGRTIAITQDAPAAGDIVLSLNENLSTLGKEGYTLNTADVVSIAAPEAKGVLYGGTTLVQMLMKNGSAVPKGMMRDYPAYEVRSCMQDVARFYMPLDYLEEVTKYMAFFKLNEMHVHINDNGGEQSNALRVESKLYPKLNNGIKPEEVYSQEDYRNYQKEVAKYGIEVVTEIDTPAHSGFIGEHDSSLMLDGYHINLSNENVLPFIKSLLDEYLDGDDPVFQGTKFNIGTDEYNKQYSEVVRSYMNELIEYVSAKGREVRMWASLGTNGFNGTTPVSNKAVGHYWSASWASYDEMLNMGYPCINNNDGNLYTVPGAGYYHDYLDLKGLYNGWEANYLVPSYHIAKSNPLMLGSEAACWYDAKTGMSEFDIFDRTREQIALMAEKNWFGEKREGQTFEEFEARVDVLGKSAPSVNPARYVKSEGETVLSYDFENVENNTVFDGSANGYDGTLSGLQAQADPAHAGNTVLALDGTGYLSMPFDSMGFPYSIAFDLYLDGEQEENAVLFSGKDGVMYANFEGTGKIAYQRKGYTYLFDVKVPENIWLQVMLTCDNATERLYLNGMPAADGQYYKVSGASKQASSTFVLPLEEVGKGIHGSIDNIVIENTAKSYEEISGMDLIHYTNHALGKPASASGLEVSDGRFTADLAVDGNPSTRVSLERKDDAWWMVDLKNPMVIDKVVINWNERPNSWQLQVSDDGETWQTVHEDLKCVEKSSGIETIRLEEKVTARYVRYQQLKQFHYDGTQYYSGNFKEFEVWGFDSGEVAALRQGKELLESTEKTEDNAVLLEKLALAVDMYDWAASSGTVEDMALIVRRIQDICDALESGAVWQKTDCSRLIEMVRKPIDLISYTDSSTTGYQVMYRLALGAALDGTNSQETINAMAQMLQESIDALEERPFIEAKATQAPYQTNTADHMLDGNPYSWFWQNGEQKAGQYVEFRFRTPQKLHEVTIDCTGAGADMTGAAAVKVSRDGTDWKQVGTIGGNLKESVEFESEEVLYLRIELTAAKSNWWKIAEVTFNNGLLLDVLSLQRAVEAGADTEGCTRSSIARWNEAVAAANALIEKAEGTRDQAEAVLAALNAAREALEPIGDTAPLAAAIEEAETASAEGVTAYSYAQLQAKLAEAREMLADPSDAGERAIGEMIESLQAAKAALKPVINGVDTSALDELLDQRQTDGRAYSYYSWKAYEAILQEAQAYSAGSLGEITSAGVEEYVQSVSRIAGSLKTKDQTNIALHKPVTCSGLEVDREDVRADKVTDGDLTTRIALHQKHDAWITIDLEEETLVDRVILRWAEAPRKYKIQVSTDNEKWTDVHENLKAGDGKGPDKKGIIDTIDFVPVNARYVRYQQIEMQTIGYSGTCWEFEVYASDMSLYTDELAWQKEQAEAMDSQTLLAEDAAALQAAIDAAGAALAGSEQAAIEEAASTLRALRIRLASAGDAAALESAVEQAEQLREEDYTPSTWAAFKTALDQAKALAGTSASQNAIDQALAALIDAQNSLIRKADTTLLSMAVSYAQKAEADGALEGVNEIAANEFSKALAAGQSLLADADAGQSDVNAAWSRLVRAIHMLEFRTDKSHLAWLIEQAEALDLNNYADDAAKAAFEEALAHAGEVLADPAALNEVSINAAADALEEAMASLQIKADTTLLAWLVAEVKDTDLSVYLNTEAFEAALAEAQNVLASPQSQKQVDDAVDTLHTAWMNLRRKPDESLLAALKASLQALRNLPLAEYTEEQQAKINSLTDRIDAALKDSQLDAQTARTLHAEAESILAWSRVPSETVSSARKAGTSDSKASSVRTAASMMQSLWVSAASLGAAAAALLGWRRRNRKQ